MGQFAQGDLVEKPPLFFSGTAKFGITSLVRELGEADEDDEIFDLEATARPPFGMITTESCDIVEDDARTPRQPFVSVAPVYDFNGRVDDARAALIRQRRVSYLYPIEASELRGSGPWAADLRLEMPIEKGWLVGRTPIRFLADERQQWELSTFLAARRDRPVLPSSIHGAIVKPTRRWIERMRPERREALIGNSVVRLIFSGPRSAPDGIGLIVVGTGGPVAEAAREEWAKRFPTMKAALDQVGVSLLETEFTTLDTIPARRYLESSPIDLSF